MDMELQPWDTSAEKAKELKFLDFGSPETIRQQASPVRTAHDRNQARAILREIMTHGPIVSKSGLTARLTSGTIGKMISSDALNKSYDKNMHYMALANLDRLFAIAIEPWLFSLNPGKNNQGLKARHYLYAPFEYKNAVRIVKFIVKEYNQPDLSNKLYSIEALDIMPS